MKLQEIFSALTYGELSQVSIGGGNAGEILESAYPRVVNHINLALTALFKRFNLREGRVVLELVPSKTVYPLTSDYAQSNTKSKQLIKYLIDDETPFKDDLLKVERVRTEAEFDLPLNDGSQWAVSTPSMTSLKVPADIVNQAVDLPDELKTETLELVYRAKHPQIVVPSAGIFDPAKVEVQLPDSHLEALLYFVASRVNNPIGMTNEFHAGNTWYAKYENACQELENQGLQVDRGSENTGISRGGWV